MQEDRIITVVAILCLSCLAVVKMLILGTNGLFCLFVASLIGLIMGINIPQEIFYQYLKKMFGGGP